jgi:hypothetical protein
VDRRFSVSFARFCESKSAFFKLLATPTDWMPEPAAAAEPVTTACRYSRERLLSLYSTAALAAATVEHVRSLGL